MKKQKGKWIPDIGDQVCLVYKVVSTHLDGVHGEIIGHQGGVFMVKAFIRGKTKYVNTDTEHMQQVGR